MSLHRQHYMDIAGQADRGERFDGRMPSERADAPPPLETGGVIAIVIACVFVALVGLHALVTHSLDAQSTQVSPVRTSPAQALQDAHVAGFRAGHAEAIAQGCKLPALTAPIGTQ